MQYQRSTFETYIQILKLCIKPKKISHVMFDLHLNHNGIHKKLDFLIQHELVCKIQIDNRHYLLQDTKKGLEIATKYADVPDLFRYDTIILPFQDDNFRKLIQ